MKVLLDVGAHIGQTLAAAKRWDFDRIVCFEPVQRHIDELAEMADWRTEIKPYGLWDRDAVIEVFNPGSQGASLWKRPGRPENSETCVFKSAAEWLRDHTHPYDTIWMKLNVEGAELDVITDLLDSCWLDRIAFLQVMWDARKIPEIAGRLNEVRDRVEAKYQPPRVVSSVMFEDAATHTERIDRWLKLTGGVELL
jgi:FkbM family methyltransferase